MPHGFERIISADSHVMEPRDLWDKALYKRFGEHTPRIVREHNGREGTFYFGDSANKTPRAPALAAPACRAIARRRPRKAAGCGCAACR